mgnify:CR=1 FL=1
MPSPLAVVPAFFDMETMELNANYGRIHCASIRHYGEETLTLRIDETKIGRKEKWNDRDLAVAIRDELEKQFMIISYNGVMFDLKYLNSRLMFHRERVLKKPLHKDLLWTAKTVFALSDNRLVTVQEFLGLDASKTRLRPDMWNRAAAGDPVALDYVCTHCEADVLVLEQVFEHLVPFIKEVHSGG